jgi:Nif-specific regulatory protein
MSNAAHAFLVLRRPHGGFGNVIKLYPAKRYVLGRAESNEVVLHDELCSRQHAEVYHESGEWLVRDSQSLNGTRVNDAKLSREHELRPGDEIGVGRSRLVFVTSLADLPAQQPAGEPPSSSSDGAGITVVNRMGQTRFDFGSGNTLPQTATGASDLNAQRLAGQLSLLYRLALKMGAAGGFEELVEVVITELLEATAADAAAVLQVTDKQAVKLAAFHSKDQRHSYAPVPPAILQEVLGTKQAVMAEDRNRLRAAPPKAGPTASSLICAPVIVSDRIDFLLHLYCANPMQTLSQEDLELAVAVCKQLAVASQGLKRQMALREENQRLKAQVATEVQLIGASPAILNIEAQVTRVAPTNATVLIRGESGAGKELVARAIHLSSPRKGHPFVCLNCAALAESLLESELFGHEKGAFTGATERKIGKFEAAHNGSIFLDEIGEMPPNSQAKLLRILEGHPYERVGGSEPVRVNVRVVAATNRPLEEAVGAKQFRPDLYFRLNVVEIRVPPLRERASDIPLLAEHFLRRFLLETGRKIVGLTPAAVEKMKAYHWPGNVRELRNVLERAVALSSGNLIDAADIWLSNLDAVAPPPKPAERAYEPLSLEALEKLHISETLRYTNWVKSQAAQILGIERSTLDRKIRAYDIRR